VATFGENCRFMGRSACIVVVIVPVRLLAFALSFHAPSHFAEGICSHLRVYFETVGARANVFDKFLSPVEEIVEERRTCTLPAEGA
jgi:hypothetical protein